MGAFQTTAADPLVDFEPLLQPHTGTYAVPAGFTAFAASTSGVRDVEAGLRLLDALIAQRETMESEQPDIVLCDRADERDCVVYRHLRFMIMTTATLLLDRMLQVMGPDAGDGIAALTDAWSRAYAKAGDLLSTWRRANASRKDYVSDAVYDEAKAVRKALHSVIHRAKDMLRRGHSPPGQETTVTAARMRRRVAETVERMARHTVSDVEALIARNTLLSVGSALPDIRRRIGRDVRAPHDVTRPRAQGASRHSPVIVSDVVSPKRPRSVAGADVGMKRSRHY